MRPRTRLSAMRVAASSTFRAIRLYKYQDNFDGRMQFALEVLLILFVFFYFFEEVWEV